MEFFDVILLIMVAISVLSLFKKPKEYPKWRREAAKRYFNGSRGEQSPEESEKSHTHGLAMVVKDGKPRFVKQSKPILEEWDV